MGLRRFYPKHFELEAVTVDLGFENLDLSRMQALCDELEDSLYDCQDGNCKNCIR